MAGETRTVSGTHRLLNFCLLCTRQGCVYPLCQTGQEYVQKLLKEGFSLHSDFPLPRRISIFVKQIRYSQSHKKI